MDRLTLELPAFHFVSQFYQLLSFLVCVTEALPLECSTPIVSRSLRHVTRGRISEEHSTPLTTSPPKRHVTSPPVDRNCFRNITNSVALRSVRSQSLHASQDGVKNEHRGTVVTCQRRQHKRLPSSQHCQSPMSLRRRSASDTDTLKCVAVSDTRPLSASTSLGRRHSLRLSAVTNTMSLNVGNPDRPKRQTLPSYSATCSGSSCRDKVLKCSQTPRVTKSNSTCQNRSPRSLGLPTRQQSLTLSELDVMHQPVNVVSPKKKKKKKKKGWPKGRPRGVRVTPQSSQVCH